MRRPWIKGKDFLNFHWTKKISSRRGREKLGKRGVAEVFFWCDFFGKGKRKRTSFGRWWKEGEWIGGW
jgi:hypothetical protein